jgi:hypothetical protein
MSTYQDETSHVWNCEMLLLEWKESEWNPKRMDVYLYARKKDGFARSEKNEFIAYHMRLRVWNVRPETAVLFTWNHQGRTVLIGHRCVQSIESSGT